MKRMKRAAIAAAILTLAFGCKKDPAPPPEESREPSAIISDIVGNLETADSISVFVGALKNLSLSTIDVEEGVTVFAPLNDDEALAQQALVMGKKSAIQAFEASDLTPTVLRDHIVKGVIKLAELTNERMLTSLSGKELKVSRAGNRVWINGVQIGSEEIGATADQVVYTVKELLSGTSVDDELQTTSLEVVVWDATAWTPELEKGALAAGATVGLYRSQPDYANDIVAYEAETDTEGKAVFSDIEPGEYFIAAKYDDKHNIFYPSLRAPAFFGMAAVGIFQSAEDIENAPLQPDAAPGNFQWMDSNADGVINADDLVAIPYESAEVKDGRAKTIEIFIGHSDNAARKPLPTAEFEDQLRNLVNSVNAWHKRLAVADAVLSGTGTMDWIPERLADEYRAFLDFSVQPNNPVITGIWNQGYQLIDALNRLEPRTEEAIPEGRLQLVRAYIYLQLTTYFGSVPLSQEAEPGNFNNSNPDAVHNFVKQELEKAEGVLPRDGGTIDGSKAAAQVLLARAALLRKNYDVAADYIDRVINSGDFALAAPADVFDALSPEYIWNVPLLSDEIRTFFYDRTAFPLLRYTEVVLAGVEAKLAVGNKAAAVQYYNQLANRDGIALVDDSSSDAVLTNQLRSLWNDRMRREGTTFANYVRWEITTDSLAHRGFRPHQSVLPIPQPVIDGNPQMKQNSGY